MSLSIIVAAAENGVIGRNGSIPWHQGSDLKRFRELTKNHTVIMGRKTFESLKKPLKDRRQIVLTKDPGYKASGALVANSLDQAIDLSGSDETFVIGGQAVFESAMSKVDKIYLTLVHAKPEGGDTFFSYDPEQWREELSEDHEADQNNQVAFTYKNLVRNN